LLSTVATSASPPTTYAISVSDAVNANYDITYVNGILTVNGVPTLLIRADSFTITYGALLPTFTSTISGFLNNDDASIITGLSLTSPVTANSGVGSYVITPSNASATGYEIAYQSGSLTINPAPLIITADNLSRFYGSVNPALTATFTGLVKNETAAVVSGLTLGTTATHTSHAGTYAITPSGATADNYTITLSPGTLTVNPAPLTVTIDNYGKLYGDLNPLMTYTASGFVLGHTEASFDSFGISTSATQFSDVGNYAITTSITGALAANYSITSAPGILAINPRPVSVVIGSGTREYGELNPTFTVGLFGDDPAGTTNFFITNISAGSAITAATPSSLVGTYTTTIADPSAAYPNFDFTLVPGTLTVTPAPLTVTANNASRLYGSANPVFSGTTTGLKLSDTLADVFAGSAFTTNATVTSNVGTYTITANNTLLNNNYTVTTNPGTLTVTQAPLFIAPALSSRFYGDPDPVFTLAATGLLNNDTTSVVTNLNFSGSAPAAGVGSSPISILSGTAINYALTFGTGTLNILPRPLTITANDFTREYGEANPAFTANITGLASFDNESIVTGLSFSTPATASSSVIPGGGYGINVTSNAISNYAITYAPGTLTITPAPLQFGLGSFFRTYGQATPEMRPDLISGLKLNDTVDLLGATVVGPPPTANVGTYAINIALSNPNYTVPNASGEIQILPAPIGVIVGNVARRYGDANPAPSSVPLTVSGLAFGQSALDVLSLNFGVDARASVGNYPIAPELISPNYQISSLSMGNLAVLTRQIALKPANVVRYYGDDNPAYQILVAGDGLASFDRISDVAFTDRLILDSILTDGLPSSLMDVGLRQTRVQLTGNPNYEVISVPGLFAILPRPITLITSDATATENRTPPIFSTTATNLVSGQTLQSAFPDLTYLVFAQNAPAAVGDPLTPSTYPIADAYTEAAFRANYPARNVATRPPGGGIISVNVPIDLPSFELPTVIRGTIGLTPLQLFGLNGLINPISSQGDPSDDPEPVINYIQPTGLPEQSSTMW
jgi:hypothetical protein